MLSFVGLSVCLASLFFCQLILLFNLFLLLFISLTALFGIIYGFYCTISTNIYLYLQYFQQKVFSFSKISRSQIGSQCLFGQLIFCQLFLLFSLFLLLFMDPTAIFCTIYRSYCTISTNIYLYLRYLQQKVFNFNKISGFQTDY